MIYFLFLISAVLINMSEGNYYQWILRGASV